MNTLISFWLERLVATSLQTVVLTALVMGLCRSLPRLPATVQCWLWWLVGLQALFGLCVSPLALPWLPQTPTIASPPLITHVSTVPPIAASQPSSVPFAIPAPPTWQLVVAALWTAGVLLMGWWTLRGWRATHRLLDESEPCSDPILIQALALAAKAQGFHSAPVLRFSSQIDSPQLVGPFRPVLLLPAQSRLTRDELHLALTHELIHLRRGDLWWGLVPVLARLLFFFHPLIHLAMREYCITREAACDATVIASDGSRRHEYGRLLLRLGVESHPSARLASASPTFLSLKRRLLMLQIHDSFSRLGAYTILTAVAAIGVMPLRLIAAPESQTNPPPRSTAHAVDPANATAEAGEAASGPTLAQMLMRIPGSSSSPGIISNVFTGHVDLSDSKQPEQSYAKNSTDGTEKKADIVWITDTTPAERAQLEARIKLEIQKRANNHRIDGQGKNIKVLSVNIDAKTKMVVVNLSDSFIPRSESYKKGWTSIGSDFEELLQLLDNVTYGIFMNKYEYSGTQFLVEGRELLDYFPDDRARQEKSWRDAGLRQPGS